jgi:cobalt/nickel transport system ATP-binding protein
MSSAPLIAVNDLAVGYAGRDVIAKADLTLNAGERLALLGANGAGKSTLLRALVGLLPITRGSIEAFGRERRTEADFREVRLRAGLVFQDPDDQLFCPTVIEDVAFGPLNLGQSMTEAKATAMAVLERLGLAGFAERVTHRLSGGEKRLISIAAVLAMAPEVLLLDEPTTGLDPAAYERLCALLLSLPQAMIIVSHDPVFLARLANRGLLLRDGRTHAGTLHSHDHVHSHAHFHFDGGPHHG